MEFGTEWDNPIYRQAEAASARLAAQRGGPLIPPREAARSAQALGQYEARLASTTSAQRALNHQMGRHGALSTEFIGALSRGQISLRQLGNELVLTAGKFGGWLAAGAVIFGVIGMFRTLWSGATEAATGVIELDRVIDNLDPSAAQQRLRDFSLEFQLPIEEVANASFQMGKIFHDQEDAFEATRAVLYAVKVGELEVASASRYLTAIQQGYNLEAEEMVTLLDQANEAQNRYGVNIEQLLAGTARAAGSFRQAGGDVTTLIGLITTLARATGQTGASIGTAIQRAPHFISTPGSRETLEALNIDATQPIDALFQEAIRTAEQLAPGRQRELASAMFGTRYGARFGVALLEQGPLLRQVMAEVAPEAAGGSAQRELEIVRDEILETIGSIGDRMQALGAGFAQVGLMAPVELFLKTLKLALTVANDLVTAFAGLPAPLRQALVTGLQLYGALKLMRALQVGALLPEGLGRTALTTGGYQAAQSGLVAELQLRQTAQQELHYQAVQKQIVAESELAAVRSRSAVSRTEVVAAEERLAQATRHRAAMNSQAIATEANLARARAGQTVAGAGAATTAGAAAGAGAAGAAPTQAVAQTVAAQQRSILSYGILGGILARGADSARTAAATAQASVVRSGGRMAAARGAMRGFGGALGGLARGIFRFIGPLDILAVGSFLLWQAFKDGEEALAASDQAFDEAWDRSKSFNERMKNLQEAIDRNLEDPGVFDFFDNMIGVLRDASGYTALFGEKQTQFEQRLEQANRDIETKGELGLKAADIRARLKHGEITPAQAREEGFGDLVKEIREEEEKTVEQAAKAFDERMSIYKEQRDAPTARLQANVLRQAVSAIDAARESGDMAKAIELENQLFDGIQARMEADIERGLEFAGTVQAGDEVIRDAVEVMRGTLDPAMFERGISRARERIEALQEDIPRLRSEARGSPLGFLLDLGFKSGTVEDARQSMLKRRERIKQLRERIEVNDEVREEIERQAAIAGLEMQTAIRESRLSLFTSRVADPLAQARRSIGAIGRDIERAIEVYGRGTNEVRKLLQERSEAINQRIEAELDLIQARGELDRAGIDPDRNVALLRSELSTEQAVLQRMLAAGRRTDPAELIRQRATILELETQIAEEVEERARELDLSRFDVLRARAEAAGNEVRAAAIGVREALAQMEAADTAPDRRTALAEVIRARAEKRQAIFDTEIEDIEHGAIIGKLTLQQQITQYQNLLETLKLNRDQRRDLRQRIHQLREDAESASEGFDLQLGNIRLPTVYEIRRAIRGGVNQQSQVSITQTNHFNATGANADEIVTKQSQQFESAARSARSMARSAGL